MRGCPHSQTSMNQLLNECHAARTGRRRGIGPDESYARPRRVAQFRGALEEDGADESLPRGPTEAELDALEAKHRTETPAGVSEPLELPVEAAEWQLADGTTIHESDPFKDWDARRRGAGVEALAAARAARAAAEADAPPSPAGSLPSPVGRPDSTLGRAIDAAIREADEALAAIDAGLDDVEAADTEPLEAPDSVLRQIGKELEAKRRDQREPLEAPDSVLRQIGDELEAKRRDRRGTDDNASDSDSDGTTTTEPIAEPKVEPTATGDANSAKIDSDPPAEAPESKNADDATDDDATDTDDEPVAVGDPAYGIHIKMLDAAQRGDHAAIEVLLREAAPAARQRLAGSRARVGRSFTSPTPLELAAAVESEEAAVECSAALLRYTRVSSKSVAAARRAGYDAVVLLLETAPLPQDEPPQDAPPTLSPPAPLTVGAAHTRGRLLGRKLFRALAKGDTAATGPLLAVVERVPSAVRRAAVAFTDGNRWTVLHAAAAVGDADSVAKLLTLGASPAVRTATGADVVKIACDARQTEVVGVLRRHAAGVRRKPRPLPAPETAVPSDATLPPPPPIETQPATTEAPPTPDAPERSPLFAVGARVEARFEGGDKWYAGVVEAVHEGTYEAVPEGAYDVAYDDGDCEKHIGAALVRKEGSAESSADDPHAPATDAPISDTAPVETAPAPLAIEMPPAPPPVKARAVPMGRATANNLAKACRRSDTKAVESLLDRGAPVGETLLHDVCGLANAVSIARLLVAADNGAAARLDSRGRPPLFGAVHCPDLFSCLLESFPAGATNSDTRGLTALHAAAAAGTSTVVECLIERGARIDARDDRGRVALWHAAANGHVAVVRALSARTKLFSGAENPLEAAIGRRHYDVARVLLDAGASLSNRVVELARTGPLRSAVLARRKRDDERKLARVAVADKTELCGYSHRLVGVAPKTAKTARPARTAPLAPVN